MLADHDKHVEPHAARLSRIAQLHGRQEPRRRHAPRGVVKDFATTWLRSAQFTADGTTLIAHDDANKLHTIVLPVDLLESGGQPHDLAIHDSFSSSTSILSVAAHPGFSLADSTTTWVAHGSTDLPIELRNALAFDFTAHRYPWVHRTTEKFLGANSLVFAQEGRHLVAGTRGRLAVFETERPGQEPIIDRETSTHMAMSSTTSNKDRGLVMALAVSADGVLAAGTTNRNVTIFDNHGLGEVITSFSLEPPLGLQDDCPGRGVTSLVWSGCQRYLLVAERQSSVVLVFDVRNGGQRLSCLSGREALSTQRFNIAALAAERGTDVWAGSMHGCVSVWSDVGSVFGEHTPAWSQKIADAPIGDIAWHPQTAVLATTSGGYLPPTSRDDSSDEDEANDKDLHTLGIWTLT